MTTPVKLSFTYIGTETDFFFTLGEGCRVVHPPQPSSIRVTFAAWLLEQQRYPLTNGNLFFPLQMRY